MAGIRRLFTFKCAAHGHVFDRIFSAGTTEQDCDEMPCPACLEIDERNPAYLIFICSAPSKGNRHDGSRS